MRFQKINENSVRCIITQEELDARGVVVEELIANKEKASQFLKYVLKEADLRRSVELLEDALQNYKIEFNL